MNRPVIRDQHGNMGAGHFCKFRAEKYVVPQIIHAQGEIAELHLRTVAGQMHLPGVFG